MSLSTGAIVILAYPEEFVTMIPGWFRYPMTWLGMVNDNKIAAGHSAMALIEKKTGHIHYGDFGRYVCKLGDGRTRMAHTDPDVHFDYKAKFDSAGKIIDKESLFQTFYNHPEKTHGGPVMYISLNQDVDFDTCFEFMSTMNKKGSIIYDPFGEGRSNCSRFVYDSLLKGIIDPQTRKQLKRKNPISPSPLANVFYGTKESSYKYSPEGIEEVTNKSLKFIVKQLKRKAKPGDIHIQEDVPSPWTSDEHVDFLEGLGDQSYIKLDKIQGNNIQVSKYGANKQLTYTKNYTKNTDFDPRTSFEFIHDCNAAWITVLQGGEVFRMDVIL